MSEIGDAFDFLKEVQRTKKVDNKIKSTKILQDKNIPFDSKNNGIHLVLKPDGKTPLVDFWPSTGKYIFRNTRKKGRGIFNLLKELQRNVEQV